MIQGFIIALVVFVVAYLVAWLGDAIERRIKLHSVRLGNVFAVVWFVFGLCCLLLSVYSLEIVFAMAD